MARAVRAGAHGVVGARADRRTRGGARRPPGVDPSGARIAPVVADADEASARWEIHPLADMAPLIRACLAATADESRHLIVVSDANGVLLWVEGNARVRLRAADSMNFAEGALWSEGGAGTNAIGTALAAEHAVQVFASEHFNEVVQAWTCAAAPVHDPDTGQRDRRDRPHRRDGDRAPALDGGGHRDRAGGRGAAALRDARPRRAPALPLRRPARRPAPAARARRRQRPGDRLPAARLAAGRAAARARRRRSARARRRLPVVAEPLGHEDAYWCARRRRRRRAAASRAAPAARCSLLGRDRGEADGRPAGSIVAAPAPRRDPHAAVRQPRRADQRGARRRACTAMPARAGRDPGRDLAPAQAAGRLHRDRALPAARRASSPTSRRCAACCTAARCARPRRATRARCCRARSRPAWCASARRSRAGCASR